MAGVVCDRCRCVLVRVVERNARGEWVIRHQCACKPTPREMAAAERKEKYRTEEQENG